VLGRTAGKTTMLNMWRRCCRLIVARRGSSATTSAVKATLLRQYRVTGQFASVDENLTARREPLAVWSPAGIVVQEAHSIGDDLLAQFELTDAARRPISQFSGGMRRRLDLAASLITRPALIFLDEPTTGLDPGIAARCGTRSATWSLRDRPSC